jgi:hypothetical protein
LTEKISSHFTFWNFDQKYPSVCYLVQETHGVSVEEAAHQHFLKLFVHLLSCIKQTAFIQTSLPKFCQPTVGLGKTFAKKSQPVECLVASPSLCPTTTCPLA